MKHKPLTRILAMILMLAMISFVPVVMAEDAADDTDVSEEVTEDTEVAEETEDSEVTEDTDVADETEEPSSDEDIIAQLTPAEGTVKIFTNVTGGKDEEEMDLFAAELGAALGLEIIMEKPASDYSQVLLQKLGAGEAYDLIYFNTPVMHNLHEQEVLTDITDRVENSAILGDPENVLEEEWEAIKIDDKIYASFNKKEVHRLVNVNQAKAEAAGLDGRAIDPTLDGYYEFMKAMKDEHGDDFYGVSMVLKDAWDMQPWFAAEGLKTGIVTNEDGTFSVPISQDEAAPVWEWLNMLYNEGLLDPDSATDGSGEMRSKFQSGQTALVTDWAAWTGLYNSNAGEQFPEEFEAVAIPGPQTPDGGHLLNRGDASLWGIPANAENPDGAFRVLEYFATQPGGVLLSLGIKDHDYTVEDGVYTLTEVGVSHGLDHGAPVPIYEKFERPSPDNEGYTDMNSYVEEAMEYIQYAVPETSNELTDTYKEIAGKYSIQIVTGEIAVNEGLEAMRQELTDAGILQ